MSSKSNDLRMPGKPLRSSIPRGSLFLIRLSQLDIQTSQIGQCYRAMDLHERCLGKEFLSISQSSTTQTSPSKASRQLHSRNRLKSRLLDPFWTAGTSLCLWKKRRFQWKLKRSLGALANSGSWFGIRLRKYRLWKWVFQTLRVGWWF